METELTEVEILEQKLRWREETIAMLRESNSRHAKRVVAEVQRRLELERKLYFLDLRMKEKTQEIKEQAKLIKAYHVAATLPSKIVLDV